MFEDQKTMESEFNGASDRAAVIVGASFLDEILREILLAHLVSDTDKLSIKFEVRHFLQMRMNILRWCPIPKSFAWARI